MTRLGASGLADAVGTAFFRLLAFPGFVLTEMLWPVVTRPGMRSVVLNRFLVLLYRFAIRPLTAARSMMTFAIIMIGSVLAMQLAALVVSLVTVGGTVAWSSFCLSKTDPNREDGALIVLRMIVPFCLLFGVMEGWAWRIVLT